MTLEKVSKFIADNTLLIIIAGIGYILAWGWVFYVKDYEMAKLLAIGTIGFLFGKVVKTETLSNFFGRIF